MAETSEVEILKEKKDEYIRTIKEKGEMTLADADKLKRFDCSIFMAKHPLIKKFNDWLNPKMPAERNNKTILKNAVQQTVRFAISFPLAIPNNLFLNTAARHWENQNINKYASKENRRRLYKEKLMKQVKFIFSNGLVGAALAEEMKTKDTSPTPHKGPMNPELKKKLRGLGEKPKTEVRQTQVDGNTVSRQYKGSEL